MRVFLNRLGILIYWVGFFLAVLVIFISLEGVFDTTKSAWSALFFAIILYFLGFGVRYLLSGKTDHFIPLYFRKMFRKK
jgi:hypothetical protein